MPDELFALAEEEMIEEVAAPRTKWGLSSAVYEPTAAELRAKSEEQRSRLEAIRTAIHNRSIARAAVSAIQTVVLQERTAVCLAFALGDGIKVLIPYGKAFMREPIPAETVDLTKPGGRETYLKRQKLVMERLLGTEIQYLPESIVEDAMDGTAVVIGNRTKALEIERSNYYLSPSPVIREDHAYRATVISVAAHAVTVLLGGIEKVIPQNWATNRYAADLNTVFRQNQKITVVVRHIRTESGDADCDFDLLTGEIMDCAERTAMVCPGEFTFATLSKLIPFKGEDGKKRTSMVAWIDGWDVPARLTSVPVNALGVPLKPGDKVRLKVNSVDEEGYVRGYVRSAHGTSLVQG